MLDALKRHAWLIAFPMVGRLARTRWHGATRWTTQALAWATLKIQRGRSQSDLRSVGEEWQRMFPSKDMVPILKQDDHTVFAQIRTHCPLRGTGDTAACYRMMEYDRRMLETIGGQLVVLESQAQPGRTYCEVAIRRASVSTEDLVHAHERTLASSAGPGDRGHSPGAQTSSPSSL
ncbi:MAG: hypothetical protein ACFB9M_08245 [Myxococcota bacterium]